MNKNIKPWQERKGYGPNTTVGIKDVDDEIAELRAELEARTPAAKHAFTCICDECTPAAPVVAEGLTPDQTRRIYAEWQHAGETPHGLFKRFQAAAAHPVAGSPAEAAPTLILALPDYEKRRIVIASDEVIDGERLVCVAIKEAEPMPASEAASQQTLPESECNAALRAAPAGQHSATAVDADIALWERLTPAIRQFRHNDGSPGFVFAYDMAIVDREFGALAGRPAPNPAHVELIRRLYVELFHCHQQMISTFDENDEPMWLPGVTVPAVLADAKQALELATRFRVEGGITNDSTTNLAAPAAPTDANYSNNSMSSTAQSVRYALEQGKDGAA